MKRNIIEFLITVFSIIGAILVGTKTDLTSLDTLADIALTVSTFVCWAFFFTYVLRSNFTYATIGKIFASKSLALCLVLTQATISSWSDYAYPYRDEIRIVIFSMLTYTMSKMLTYLVIVQMEERAVRKERIKNELSKSFDPNS